MTEDVKDAKITTVEKVKDPKKVEAGKKLAAISRQAKEKKAQLVSEQSATNQQAEFQLPNVSSYNALAVVGAVGVVGMIVYYTYNNKVDREADQSQ